MTYTLFPFTTTEGLQHSQTVPAAAAHAHGKTCNIQKGISFPFGNIPKSDGQVIGKHRSREDVNIYISMCIPALKILSHKALVIF
jgi:hypothetical protein